MRLKPEYLKVIDDIKYARIFSSTETVLAGLRLLKKVVDDAESIEELSFNLATVVPLLFKARPTSAMLLNSIKTFVSEIVKASESGDLNYVKQHADVQLQKIERNILQLAELTAKIASHRINDGDTILTNSYSTIVLKAFKFAHHEGKKFKVYVTESRPGSEGLVLAAELAKMGLKITIFVDSAVRYMIKDVDNVFLSSEAIAANGALINKVGSSLIALAASEARVRVFALAPTLKFSPETLLGELVVLAEGESSTILPEKLREEFGEKIKVRVPLFDVTPPEYIDAIITERGLVAPQAVVMILKEIYGWPFQVITLDEILEGLESWRK
ncbi:MAG: initiation factor 2B [Thermoprotei archaeon]|nr:MAG: initiation factor 2B [Thermoprotei archaeon]